MPKNLKDKRIDVYEIPKNVGTDNIGNQLKNLKKLISGGLWAYVRQFSQNEINACHTAGTNESMMFRINFNRQIAERDRFSPLGLYVRYKGKLYNVTRIDYFEDRNTELTLYAESGIPEGRLNVKL